VDLRENLVHPEHLDLEETLVQKEPVEHVDHQEVLVTKVQKD